jgi:nucleotide-binding universal stress UspA family protein
MLSVETGAMSRRIQRSSAMTESITRILVPVDFSAQSDRAIAYAAKLAGQVGASVELFHVVEDPFSGGVFTSEIYVPSVPEMIQAWINDAAARLESLKTSMFPHGSDVETRVVVGHAANTIVKHAHTGAFDLIVMGTHGRSGFSHMFIGSVAERVVRTASCAVLTVHGEHHVAAQAPKAA